MPITVSIVEDNEQLRGTLARVINRAEGFRCISQYANAEAALETLPKDRPDVVLMDINLPGMNGVECVRQLKARMPDVQFIMLTVYEDNNRLFNSLVAGASGYLLKRTPPSKLISAIREAYDGGSPMTPQIARRVVQHFQHTPEPASELKRLSPREKDVLDQLAKGYRYKEIVDHLGISSGTLHSYIRNIYEKLHVHSRTEAVVKFLNR